MRPRVSFIRRYLYFRFRLLVPFAQIQALEAARIAVDDAFVGDRPGRVTADAQHAVTDLARRCCTIAVLT